jgi:hypothetical protein
MSRKRLTNNESFIFNESDVVNSTRSRGLLENLSVQRRLCPKAVPKQAPSNPQVFHSQSSSNARSFTSGKIGLADSARDHNANKKTATNDPSLEAILAKLENLNTESPQVASNVRSSSDGTFSNARNVDHSKSTPMTPMSQPNNNKRVLLQVVPKSVRHPDQQIYRPFKADSKKLPASNNNFVPNNNVEAQNAAENSIVHTEDVELPKRDCPEKMCICLRPLKLILCPVCGYTTTGRLRKTCQVHPKAVYLLDVDACPRCKETNNHVFMEYDLPQGFKQAVKKTPS